MKSKDNYTSVLDKLAHDASKVDLKAMRDKFRSVTTRQKDSIMTPHKTHDISGLSRHNATIDFAKQVSREKGSYLKPTPHNVESPDNIQQIESKFRQSRGVHLSLAKTLDRNISFVKPPPYSVHHYWHEVDWDKINGTGRGLIPFDTRRRPSILRDPTLETTIGDDRWDKPAVQVMREQERKLVEQEAQRELRRVNISATGLHDTIDPTLDKTIE